MTTKEDMPISSGPFHIELLHLLKENQQHHGLRHGDYQRYRQYISRKLRRIRKSLNFMQGNRSRYQAKQVTKDLLTDVRFIHLKVFEAERCWSFAMQLKNESNTEPRKRYHMISRLRKAVQQAEFAADLCQSDVCDARTKLEMNAYSKWMQGSLHFELQQWLKAKDHLESARAIYSGLADAVDEDQKLMYSSRSEELLPQIRYCAYNLGEACAADELRAMRTAGLSTASTGDVEQLDHLLAQTRASQTQSVTEVTWLGHLIPVKHDKARIAVLAIQEADNEIPKADGLEGKMALYESAVKALIEAITTVRDDMKIDPSQKPIPAGSDGPTPLEKMTRLQLLHTYLQYMKLVKTAERNLLLIEHSLQQSTTEVDSESKDLPISTNKPQELARLYDNVMQTLQEIAVLSGVAHEDTMQTDLSARIATFRAFRCYYLAQSYFQVKKFSECTALLKRSQRHATSSIELLAHLPPSSSKTAASIRGSGSPTELHSRLSRLVKQIEADELSCRATKLLEMIKDDSGKQEDTDYEGKNLLKKPLINRLDTYIEDPGLLTKSPNLINLPPDFEPIPAKPVFFDLALNHIHYPSLEHKIEEATKKKSQQNAGGGITGFVKGWLWGGGSKK